MWGGLKRTDKEVYRSFFKFFLFKTRGRDFESNEYRN